MRTEQTSLMTVADLVDARITDLARVFGFTVEITRMGTDGRFVTGWRILGG
jgi:hypothetical protein